MTIEIRNAIELRATGNKLEGYAAVFNLPSRDLGGFTERVMPGAFRRSLASGADIVALYDHDRRSMLGRTASGTLKLAEDSRGLYFELSAPNTTLGRDVLEMVTRGDINGASFAFTAQSQRWNAENTERELLDVDLHEVTITPMPAYPDTTVARRSMSHNNNPSLYALRLRLLEAGL